MEGILERGFVLSVVGCRRSGCSLGNGFLVGWERSKVVGEMDK
jgi:hypothetical protein